VSKVGDSGLRVWALSVAVFVSSLFPSHSLRSSTFAYHRVAFLTQVKDGGE
jgi:hypothetical protein